MAGIFSYGFCIHQNLFSYKVQRLSQKGNLFQFKWKILRLAVSLNWVRSRTCRMYWGIFFLSLKLIYFPKNWSGKLLPASSRLYPYDFLLERKNEPLSSCIKYQGRFWLALLESHVKNIVANHCGKVPWLTGVLGSHGLGERGCPKERLLNKQTNICLVQINSISGQQRFSFHSLSWKGTGR